MGSTGELWAGEELGFGLARPSGGGMMGVAPPRVADVVVVMVELVDVEEEEEILDAGIKDAGRVAGNSSLFPANAISFMA